MKHLIATLMLTSVGLSAQQTAEIPLPAKGSALAGEKFPVMEFYGLIPRSLTGGGFGMGIFSSPVLLPVESTGAELRFGGEMQITWMDRFKLKNVPLLAPQTGNATVNLNETLFSLNAVARLSAPWKSWVSPYIDGFAGLRLVNAGITVTADQYQPGYERSTSDNLDVAPAFQYGATAGLMFKLGRNVKLNTAVIYSRSDRPGTLSNIHSAGLNGTTVVMDKKSLKQDLIQFKVGLTLRLDFSDKGNSGHNCECCGASRSSRGGIFTPGAGAGRSAGRAAGAANRVGTGIRISK